MNTPDLQMILDASLAPETRLPQSEPLTLTRNFAWIVLFCVASLLTLPVIIAWTASILLN